MSDKLYIIGVGPGDADYIYPAAKRRIEAADVLIGGRRNLELFHHLGKEELVIGSDLERIGRYIEENAGKKSMAVLASGDPGIFGIGEYLKTRLGSGNSLLELETYPGIGSVQFLCARTNKKWEDLFPVSLHGRKVPDLPGMVRKHGRVAVFTGGGSTPGRVCRELAAGGLGDAEVTVGENLSYPEERIVAGTAEEIGKMEFAGLSVMLVEYGHDADTAGKGPEAAEHSAAAQPDASAGRAVWEFAAAGIPDELFFRGDVPMTKEEVRTVSLSKLRLKDDSVLYDIGAGTGSVSVECGLRLKNGHVYAIEKERDALSLIRKNIGKFALANVTIVAGEAPEILSGLPAPDRIFIGGTGGSLDAILDWAAGLERRVRLVVNAVAMETVGEALEGLKGKGFGNIDITCVAVSRGRLAGNKHLMQGLNPVYIISAENKPQRAAGSRQQPGDGFPGREKRRT